MTHALCAQLHTVKIPKFDENLTTPSMNLMHKSHNDGSTGWFTLCNILIGIETGPSYVGSECLKISILPSESSSSSSASRILTSSGTLRLSKGLHGNLESAILFPLIQFLIEGSHTQGRVVLARDSSCKRMFLLCLMWDEAETENFTITSDKTHR